MVVDDGCDWNCLRRARDVRIVPVRRAIQHSRESLRVLARRYGINQKTVGKWKKRTSTADLPTGPKDPKSTKLSIEDCLYALQATIPHLTRSSSHRCL